MRPRAKSASAVDCATNITILSLRVLEAAFGYRQTSEVVPVYFTSKIMTRLSMLSAQADPDDMSIDEYRALSTVPWVGCRIQWQNILLQLVMPIVALKKVETGPVIL
ncbi:hypothetical protein BDZ45DRAFT_808927 [Acephala macrosclerotiorum]|nr:hypothetical protein BDZ45DRAFT_808927 [Acephala macrosclerotiorum]